MGEGKTEKKNQDIGKSKKKKEKNKNWKKKIFFI